MKKEVQTKHGIVTGYIDDSKPVKEELLDSICEQMDVFGWSAGTDRVKIYGLDQNDFTLDRLIWKRTVPTETEYKGEFINLVLLEEAEKASCNTDCILYRNGNCHFGFNEEENPILSKLDCSRVAGTYNSMKDE